MSDVDAAYAAGLIDGEGSIMLYQRGDIPAVRPIVTLANTDLGMIKWLIEVTGLGTVLSRKRLSENHQQQYTWQIHGDGVATFLTQLRPFIRTKAVQAELAIETQERLRVPSLKADRSWQAEYRLRMKDLNARGAAANAKKRIEGLL